MFQVLAIVDKQEFEEIKGILIHKTGYAFDTITYSDTSIEYNSPFIKLFVCRKTKSHISYCKYVRADIIFINKNIISKEFIDNVFEFQKEKPLRIYESFLLLNRLRLSMVVDVLIIAERLEFNYIREKLRISCLNTRNRLLASRYDQLMFDGVFIRIRVIRKRNDHCESLRGCEADVIFINKKVFEDIEARSRILRSCRTGNYGVHDIDNLLKYGWCN